MTATPLVARLSDVAELNPRAETNFSASTPVSFVPMASISAEAAITENVEERQYGEVCKGYTPFARGDLLVAKITPCFENGKIAQANIQHAFGFGSTEFHVIRPRTGRANARYLLHFLRQDRVRREGERRMTGSGGQRRIPEHFLAQLEIPLLSFQEQQRTADILDRADALRAKRLAALNRLDALTQSIFLDFFNSPSAFDWAKVKLDEVAEVITGYPFPSERFQSSGDSVNLCRGANVLPGRIDWSDRALWPRANAAEFERFNLVPGDVVLAMDRPWISEGLKLAYIRPEDCPVLLVQRVARIRGKEGISNTFLFHLLRQPAFTAHCRPTETTVPHISPKEIRAFPFYLPPEEEQQKFVRHIQAIERIAAAQQDSLAKLNDLFAALQHRAFRGEL